MSYKYKDYLTFNKFRNKKSLDSILDFVPITFDSGLDLMCGTGIVGLHIQSNRNVEMTFADKSREVMIDILGSKHVCDIALMDSFKNNQFDFIVCRGGLNNLSFDQWSRAISEIKRVLQSKGILIIQDHFPMNESQFSEINSIEQQIARAEEKDTIPWIPILNDFKSFFQGYGFDYTTFLMEINLEKRMKKKNLILTIPENSCLKNGYLTYPISTIQIKRLSV